MAGFRCAPEMRPKGVIATRLPAPPSRSPVRNSRTPTEGIRCGIDACGANITATAPTTQNMRKQVPTNSQPYSGAWLRNSRCQGSEYQGSEPRCLCRARAVGYGLRFTAGISAEDGDNASLV